MTINELITPELRDAWQIANRFPKPSPLGVMCNGIRDLLAALLESEFKRQHRLDGWRSLIWCVECSYGDVHRPEPPDPRHSFTWSDWQAAATKILEKK